MSSRNWKRHTQAERVRRQGAEERDSGGNLPPVPRVPRAPAMSKEELRREADRLLDGYSGPVERVPIGLTTPSSTVRSERKVADTTPKPKRSKRFAEKSARLDTAVPPGLVIYCDGACEPNPGIGGWAFVVYRDDVEIHSDCGGENPATNNTMEITGALMALRWIADRGIVEPVRILCDSMYVVNGANDWRHSWKARGWRRKGKNPEIANLALWQELDRLLTLVPIKLEWCKGHAGIIGNERADELSLIGREAALAAEASDCGDLILEQMRYAVA